MLILTLTNMPTLIASLVFRIKLILILLLIHFYQVFEENLAINLDPEKLMYLFIYLYIVTSLVLRTKNEQTFAVELSLLY